MNAKTIPKDPIRSDRLRRALDSLRDWHVGACIDMGGCEDCQHAEQIRYIDSVLALDNAEDRNETHKL